MNNSSLAKPVRSDEAVFSPSSDLAVRAQKNALYRLIRCLFAEGILDPALLSPADDGSGVLFPVREPRSMLWFERLERAPANTLINRGAIALLQGDGQRRLIDTADALLDVLLPSFDFVPADAGAEKLKADIASSIANDMLARRFRESWDGALREEIAAAGAGGLCDYMRRRHGIRQAAILLDQWGSLEGHPFYPTWKTKPSLSEEEVTALSPEFAAVVPVRIAALRKEMAHVERMPHIADARQWFAAHYPETARSWATGLAARGLQVADWLPLPIHGWHLEHHVRQHFAPEIEQGILLLDGPDIATRPSMSFRTMLPDGEEGGPFIKLPVAIWLTSEQRSLQAKSIHMGPRISTVISDILADEQGFGGSLEIFTEDLGIHFKHAERQDDAEGKHLSVLFRATGGRLEREDGLLPVTVAALLARAPSGDGPLISELVDGGSGMATAAAVVAFFRMYARAVIHPAVQIYLLYGIALEAHQQNTSILFDREGRPVRMLIRDFGDGRTYAPLLRARGHDLRPYVYKGILPTVFEDDIEPVRSFVIDACFVCHLHEVALALTRHYGLAGDILWRVMGEETERAFAAARPRMADARLWHAERHHFLGEGWSTRSVLRMHLQKYSNYRLQHQLPNPMGMAGA
ncbi:IucA/IucC family protein [Radicibacter daui]|uniref:IucA/IucC family protein n=1 Tax=Radicibacter daui TaxID=3064829 RepID=UPI004046D8B1